MRPISEYVERPAIPLGCQAIYREYDTVIVDRFFRTVDVVAGFSGDTAWQIIVDDVFRDEERA